MDNQVRLITNALYDVRTVGVGKNKIKEIIERNSFKLARV